MSSSSNIIGNKNLAKDSKTLLLERLHRISGQVSGIENMVSGNKDCLSVVQQITAVRSALGKVATLILSQESCKLATKSDKAKFEKIISNLLDFHV